MIRFFDIFFSLIAIIILSPILFPIVIALKLTGEHHVFYMQSRIGRYGKEFKVLKFATMLENSPNLPGGTYTLKNDPRILPFGNFLRKTKINELPQLVNVLIGQMSIIGYRPLIAKGYNGYSEQVKAKIYNYRPGLSGIASIALRNEEEKLQKYEDRDNFYFKVIMPYKGNLETWFVDNYTISNYFKIIFFTITVILNRNSEWWKIFFRDLPRPPQQLENDL
jgi:lipopolysaccharide/colanic/teichoic acid biosynthesis glycosyltransferase